MSSLEMEIAQEKDYSTQDVEKDKTQHTLAIIKPDAIQHKSSIIERIQKEGFNIIQEKQVQMKQADLFYREHEVKPFYQELTQWMSSAPVYAMVLEKEDAVQAWRALMGPTDSIKAKSVEENSIRALYGTDGFHNAVHGSDCLTSADREINLIFGTSNEEDSILENSVKGDAKEGVEQPEEEPVVSDSVSAVNDENEKDEESVLKEEDTITEETVNDSVGEEDKEQTVQESLVPKDSVEKDAEIHVEETHVVNVDAGQKQVAAENTCLNSTPEKPNAVNEPIEEYAEIALDESIGDEPKSSPNTAESAVSLLEISQPVEQPSSVETADVDAVEINENGTAIADGVDINETADDGRSDVTSDNEPYKPDVVEEPPLPHDEDHLIETVVHGDEMSEMMEPSSKSVSPSESYDKPTLGESTSSAHSEETENQTISRGSSSTINSNTEAKERSTVSKLKKPNVIKKDGPVTKKLVKKTESRIASKKSELGETKKPAAKSTSDEKKAKLGSSEEKKTRAKPNSSDEKKTTKSARVPRVAMLSSKKPAEKPTENNKEEPTKKTTKPTATASRLTVPSDGVRRKSATHIEKKSAESSTETKKTAVKTTVKKISTTRSSAQDPKTKTTEKRAIHRTSPPTSTTTLKKATASKASKDITQESPVKKDVLKKPVRQTKPVDDKKEASPKKRLVKKDTKEAPKESTKEELKKKKVLVKKKKEEPEEKKSLVQKKVKDETPKSTDGKKVRQDKKEVEAHKEKHSEEDEGQEHIERTESQTEETELQGHVEEAEAEEHSGEAEVDIEEVEAEEHTEEVEAEAEEHVMEAHVEEAKAEEHVEEAHVEEQNEQASNEETKQDAEESEQRIEIQEDAEKNEQRIEIQEEAEERKEEEGSREAAVIESSIGKSLTIEHPREPSRSTEIASIRNKFEALQATNTIVTSHSKDLRSKSPTNRVSDMINRFTN